MMKRILTALFLSISLLTLSGVSASAQDLQKGIAAYNRGDYAAALKELRPLAERGDVAAQNILGEMYAEGEGVAQDYAEAVKWYRKAAEQGNSYAQRTLALSYRKGRGVRKDPAKAIEWYRKGYEQGHEELAFTIGEMYDSGEGVLQDYAQAVKWYRRSLDDNSSSATTALAFLYSRSGGLDDNVIAHMWANIAAAGGSSKAKKLRDIITKELSPADLKQAQQMAKRCMASDYTDC